LLAEKEIIRINVNQLKETLRVRKQSIKEARNSPKEQAKVRRAAKAAVVEGDSERPDTVTIAGYDTKPVHSISMACTS